MTGVSKGERERASQTSLFSEIHEMVRVRNVGGDDSYHRTSPNSIYTGVLGYLAEDVVAQEYEEEEEEEEAFVNASCQVKARPHAVRIRWS